jgi:hypothetical protein
MNCDLFRPFVKILSIWKDSKNKTKVIIFVRIVVEHKTLCMGKKIANINVTCKAPKEIKWVLGVIGKTPFKPLHKKAKLMNLLKIKMNTLNATFINFFTKVT